MRLRQLSLSTKSKVQAPVPGLQAARLAVAMIRHLGLQAFVPAEHQ